MNTELIARLRTRFKNMGHMLDKEAADALEAAQLAGEPVAIFRGSEFRNTFKILKEIPTGAKLYTHPAAPQVPMTEADADKLLLKVGILANLETLREIIRATEAHHNIGVKP